MSTDKNEPYLLITADTHAGGSHAQYREYLDPQYRDRFDAWRGQYKNPAQDHYGSKKQKNWDLEIRSNDQNSQGVVGEVVFPNTVPPFFKESIVTAPQPRPEEYELCLAGVRAHNRWLKDFCAEDPDRRAGIGVILPHDMDEALKDIEFIAKAGLRGGVLLPLISPDASWLKPLYDSSWDRIYAALEDHDLVMNHHTGQGLPNYRQYASPIMTGALYLTETIFYAQSGYRHLILSGVFQRHPKLKYIMTESGCSWVPEVLARLDHVHEGMRSGTVGELTYKGMAWPLEMKPSEYAQRNCFYGASFPSQADLDGIELVGEDNVLWGNDYPHYEGTFPHTLETLRYTFHNLSETRRRKLLGFNAARLYNFDLEKLKVQAAKYGPTPEQVNNQLKPEDVPQDSTCMLFTNLKKKSAA